MQDEENRDTKMDKMHKTKTERWTQNKDKWTIRAENVVVEFKDTEIEDTKANG